MEQGTGIVRRIDDLGRVVIPKEVRRGLKIKEGDPLEIFVSIGEGFIKLRKFDITEVLDYKKLWDTWKKSNPDQAEEMDEIEENEKRYL